MTTKFDDSELRRRVLAELDWEPTLDASAIGVAAKEGVVTLTGSVTSYAQKRNAERATKRVFGVSAVAEDLVVKLPGEAQRGDTDVAQSVLSALRFNVSVPHDKVQVTVEDGWVTLDGEVEWQYQKTSAESAIKYTMGVKGIINHITVKPRISASDVKSKIQSAFTRHAQLDANNIKVDVTDSKVALRGSVSSWREREEAEQAAWSAPGVSRVENDVVVSPW
jgi:osmotically-inducible protein OsmY